MDYIYIFLSLLFAVTGVAGAIVPVLPGPPISYVGLLLLLLCDGCGINMPTVVIAGVLAVVVTLFDYVAPVWFTKRSGGSKAGVWGATLGLLVGFFFSVPGIILGPFIGAFLGELYAKTPADKALGVSFVSFIAFIVTTGFKLIYAIALLVIIVKECVGIIFP